MHNYNSIYADVHQYDKTYIGEESRLCSSVDLMLKLVDIEVIVLTSCIVTHLTKGNYIKS